MSSYSSKTTSSSIAIDENKKKTTLLKDNSWIKRQTEEEELVDEDLNFGKSLLHRYKPNETLVSPSDPEPVKSTKPTSSSTSVHALTKRFGVNQDEPKTSPSSKTSTSYTRRYTSGMADTPSMVTTVVKEEPKMSTKTTTVTKSGTTTETTIITSQNIKSAVIKSPTKTETFSERVKSSSKVSQYSAYSPTKTTTQVTEKTVTSTKDAEDGLLKDEDLSFTNGKTAVATTETVTMKGDIDAENKLYDTLIPVAIKDKSLDSTTVTSTRTATVKSSLDSYADDKFYNTLITKPVKDDVTDSTTVISTRTATVKSSLDSYADDKFYNTLITKPVKDDVTDSKTTVTSSTVKGTSNADTKTTITTTKTSYDPKNEPYDSLLSKSFTSDVSSSTTKREVVTMKSSKGSESPILSTPTSTRTISYSSYTGDIASSRTSTYSDTYNKYSYKDSYSSRPDSSYEYTSITSPSLYTSSSYRSSSWSDATLTDPTYTKSSTKSVYQSSPERAVLEKDLCTSCRKPFIGDAKMILDDMKINCHATCFKCDVCNTTLGNMKAGDSMWIYKRMVHCENCFEATRDKWRR